MGDYNRSILVHPEDVSNSLGSQSGKNDLALFLPSLGLPPRRDAGIRSLLQIQATQIPTPLVDLPPITKRFSAAPKRLRHRSHGPIPSGERNHRRDKEPVKAVQTLEEPS